MVKFEKIKERLNLIKDKLLSFWKKNKDKKTSEFLSQEKCYELLTQNPQEWNDYRSNNPDWVPSFDSWDFKDWDLNEVDFRYCSLVKANFSKVKNLNGQLLAGSDLTGARLPEDIDFKALKTVEDISRNSRPIFISIIIACVFCWLTIGTTDNLALLTNSSQSTLPFLNIKLPIYGFYIVAPILLCAMYVYFHLYLRNLWKELGELPATFPDGKALNQKAFPWFLNGLVTNYSLFLNQKVTFLDKLQTLISIVLAWWLVPFTMICIWMRSLVIHNLLLIVLHLLLLTLCLVMGEIFLNNAIKFIKYTNSDKKIICRRKSRHKVFLMIGFIGFLVGFSYCVCFNISFLITIQNVIKYESIFYVVMLPFLPLLLLLTTHFLFPNIINISLKAFLLISLIMFILPFVVTAVFLKYSYSVELVVILSSALFLLLYFIVLLLSFLIKKNKNLLYFNDIVAYFSFLLFIMFVINLFLMNLNSLTLDLNRKDISTRPDNYLVVQKKINDLDDSFISKDLFEFKIRKLERLLNEPDNDYLFKKSLQELKNIQVEEDNTLNKTESDRNVDKEKYLNILEKLHKYYIKQSDMAIDGIVTSLKEYKPISFKFANYKNEFDSILNPIKILDLKNQNLTSINASYSYLGKANLSNSNMDNANLYGVILQGAILNNASFKNANLEDANLQGASLCLISIDRRESTFFLDSNFENAVLIGANLKGVWVDIKEISNDIHKSSFPLEDVENLSNNKLKDLRIYDSRYSVNFSNTKMSEAVLQFAYLPFVNFENAMGDKVRIFNCLLKMSNFKKVYLSQVSIVNVDLAYSNFEKAFLNNAFVIKANLSHSNLNEVAFDNSYIQDTDFTYSNMKDVSLSNSTIKNVDFSDSCLVNASFYIAKDGGNNSFNNAIIDVGTYNKYFNKKYSFEVVDSKLYDCKKDFFEICKDGKIPWGIGVLKPKQ